MKKIKTLFLVLAFILVSLFTLSSCVFLSEEYKAFKEEYLRLLDEYNILNKQNTTLKSEVQIINQIDTNYQELVQNETETFALFSTLENDVIKSTLLITEKEIDYNWRMMISESGSIGSGFIIKEDDNYYYALTNNHVVSSEANASFTKIYVTDYNQKEYNGTVLYKNADYDMALVRFSKNASNPLNVITLASSDAAINDTVIAIGNPYGQLNSIGIGKVTNYQVPNYQRSAVSNVTYSNVVHSAYMMPGNSGGMLINDSLEVVGINTFGSTNSTYEKTTGLASPVSKINEFLLLAGVTL